MRCTHRRGGENKEWKHACRLTIHTVHTVTQTRNLYNVVIAHAAALARRQAARLPAATTRRCSRRQLLRCTVPRWHAPPRSWRWRACTAAFVASTWMILRARARAKLALQEEVPRDRVAGCAAHLAAAVPVSARQRKKQLANRVVRRGRLGGTASSERRGAGSNQLCLLPGHEPRPSDDFARRSTASRG